MNQAHRALRVDGEATRLRILESAGLLFSNQGYAETTSKAIAEVAGVDLASINYHFGGRSALYQSVLVEAHDRLLALADLSPLSRGDLPPAKQLLVILETVVNSVMSEENWHVRVLAREIGSPSSHLKHLFTVDIAAKLVFVLDVISAITGIPKDDPALLRCLWSVGAPCLTLLISSNFPEPVQTVTNMPKAELIRHLQEFSMAGLVRIGEQRALEALRAR
ncbi:TetR/AcrR family transcriptional regulator [Stenotrophomonas sp. TWI602]|uniref:TetR/AcrR family transcriptional regulator n=1 Tax=Stenotrophomonas sp. TWI602 TaxID=3136786 RepID=UPI003208A0DF